MPKKKPQAKPSPKRIFTRSLRVNLTKEERHEMAIDLAGEEERLSMTRQAKDEDAKMWAGKIKEHEGRIARLYTAVNSGWVSRDVEVHELEDWDNKRIIEVRVDTAEEIAERPMTEHERQKPLIPPAPPTKPAAKE